MTPLPICSVLIASHGSATYLQPVLAALENQTQGDFEVIIIDNNRRPKLRAIESCQLSKRILIVHEPQIGLSIARNLAVSRASGKYVAFLDDDTIPERSWLENLLAGLDRHAAAVAGGSIELEVHADPPDWLGEEHRRLLAELLWEGVDIPTIGRSNYICGGNMAAITQTFQKVGGFRESFGRVGEMLRSSEELEWCLRVQQAGLAVAFVASAKVKHQIEPSRLSRSYLLRRGYWQGRSDALLEYSHGRPAECGPRSNRINIQTLLRCAAEIAVVQGKSASAARWLALVREVGYCIQYAWLSMVGNK